MDEVVVSGMGEDQRRQDLQQIKERAAWHFHIFFKALQMEIALHMGWEWGWDLTRGAFVMAVQRRPVQYLDYLQGLLVVLHPLWGYQVDGILGKPSLKLCSVNTVYSYGKKKKSWKTKHWGSAGIKHKEAAEAARYHCNSR